MHCHVEGVLHRQSITTRQDNKQLHNCFLDFYTEIIFEKYTMRQTEEL